MTKTLIALLTCGILVIGLATLSAAQDKSRKEKTATTGQKIKLKIEGMSCSMCEQNCKRSLEKVEGVKVESISASEGIALLTYTGSEPISDKTLKEAVENAGYNLKKIERKDNDESSRRSDQ